MRSASANIPRPGDEANADEALLFVYDGWNRLVKVYKDDGDSESQGEIDENDTLVATYQYDGFGRRIQKTVGETTDDYYCSEGWQVLETRRGGDPDPLDQFIWDVRYIDAPVVRFHDGNTDGDYLDAEDNVLYYTTDANWNVTALVDAATGDVVERYMYDAYGKATVLESDWTPREGNASAVSNDVLFAGYRFDAETGLYATDNRIYHPTLGRWLQRDPAGYLDGANLYGYVSGDPAGLTDPTGLCGETAPNPGDINPWWIKQTGPNTFEFLLPWIEGMGTEIRLLPFLPGMGAQAAPAPSGVDAPPAGQSAAVMTAPESPPPFGLPWGYWEQGRGYTKHWLWDPKQRQYINDFCDDDVTGGLNNAGPFNDITYAFVAGALASTAPLRGAWAFLVEELAPILGPAWQAAAAAASRAAAQAAAAMAAAKAASKNPTVVRLEAQAVESAGRVQKFLEESRPGKFIEGVFEGAIPGPPSFNGNPWHDAGVFVGQRIDEIPGLFADKANALWNALKGMWPWSSSPQSGQP